MGCFRENKRKEHLSQTGELKGVVSKMIRKAKERKSTAENYHIYALLQSTIHRLEMDNYVLSCKRSVNSCSPVRRRIETCISKNCEISSQDKEVEDLLNLDSFFSRLKSGSDGSENVL